MANVPRVGDIELDQDLTFQQRAWSVQRVGWAILGLVVLAALLGAFGTGPFSSTIAGQQGDPLWVEYEQLLRFKAPASLVIHLTPGPDSIDAARLEISRSYLLGVQIQQITPQPERVVVGPAAVTYIFSITGPGEPLIVTVNLQPQQIGRLPGRMSRDNGPSVTFDQFVYP